MNEIAAIASVASAAPQAPLDAMPAATTGSPHAGTAAFGDLIKSGIEQVNTQLLASEASMQRLATGDTAQSLHQVMIQMEESRLSFQLMMQVRGRLLEAYQDIMKMQI